MDYAPDGDLSNLIKCLTKSKSRLPEEVIIKYFL